MALESIEMHSSSSQGLGARRRVVFRLSAAGLSWDQLAAAGLVELVPDESGRMEIAYYGRDAAFYSRALHVIRRVFSSELRGIVMQGGSYTDESRFFLLAAQVALARGARPGASVE